MAETFQIIQSNCSPSAAQAQGKGVLNYGGQMVEELHIRQAQALLERYQAQQAENEV